MSFTISDYSDLKLLLIEHPEWRAELRHLLLGDDLEALREAMRELAEAQRRTEERVAELAEAQRRTEERLTRLEDIVAQLAEAQRRTEERLTRLEDIVAQLAEAQRRTEERLTRLEDRADRIEDKLGRLDGRTLELIYDKKASAYFGRWLRRAEVVGSNEVWDLLEERLSPDELHEVLLTDLLVRGRATHRPDRPEVWLAVEISAVVDREDVARAVRRAELLRRAGVAGVPVVAGTSVTEGAESEADRLAVAVLQDGSGRLWDQAFAAWPI